MTATADIAARHAGDHYCQAPDGWVNHDESCDAAQAAAEAERLRAERDMAVDTAETMLAALDKAASYLLTADTIQAMSLAKGLRAALEDPK